MGSTALHSFLEFGLRLVAVLECLSAFFVARKDCPHLCRYVRPEVVERKVRRDHEVGYNDLGATISYVGM